MIAITSKGWGGLGWVGREEKKGERKEVAYFAHTIIRDNTIRYGTIRLVIRIRIRNQYLILKIDFISNL